jgi:hypothetical protein
MSFALIGSLKKPVDILIDNRTLRNVTRILGDDEWGFVFEFQKDGKRLKTAEPYWHSGHEAHKRNDMPRLGSKVMLRYDKRNMVVQSYSGHGFYKLKDEQGAVISAHFHAIIDCGGY